MFPLHIANDSSIKKYPPQSQKLIQEMVNKEPLKIAITIFSTFLLIFPKYCLRSLILDELRLVKLMFLNNF